METKTQNALLITLWVIAIVLGAFVLGSLTNTNNTIDRINASYSKSIQHCDNIDSSLDKSIELLDKSVKLLDTDKE